MKARYPKCMPLDYKVKEWLRVKKAQYKLNKRNDALCARLTRIAV